MTSLLPWVVFGLSIADGYGASRSIVNASFSTAGTSFTYTGQKFGDYYTVNPISASGVEVASASHYAGTGGDVFTFYGIRATTLMRAVLALP